MDTILAIELKFLFNLESFRVPVPRTKRLDSNSHNVSSFIHDIIIQEST